jgi:recombination protein RecR
VDSINKLISLFKDFPTVGSRTAGRFVYYLARLPKEKIDELVNAINNLKNNIHLCQFCYQPFESQGKLCQICSDNQRNINLLCIVEKENDLLSLETTKKFNGLYFILGGTVATMRKEDLSQLRIEEFKKRLKESNLTEIIVALNPTPEGRTTSKLIEVIIKELLPLCKITHLAQGIPVGGELEYADEETLESALVDRK